jgi:hypothetical protein
MKWHELRGHRDEGSHHVAVLVFEDVAVVHVAAAEGGEADGDLDDLVGIDADGVLEPAFVFVDRVVEVVLGGALERDGGSEIAVPDAIFRDLVPDRVSRENLERVEVEVDRVGVAVRLINCQTSYSPSIGKNVVISSKWAATTR